MRDKRFLPIILGPTSVGKTKIGILVSSEIGAEIISCDSRQVYQYMDIGTSKPTKQELSEVPHWLVDIVTPDVSLNAWDYALLARKRIKEIWRRGKIPLVVGGSGLYLRALIDGFFRVPCIEKSIIERLQNAPSYKLHKKLLEVDPATAHKLHPNDKMRIIRALEVYEITGTQISVLKKRRVPFDCNPVYIGLTMPRNILYKRIDERVDQMVKNGFLEEVRGILQKGYSPELNSLQTIGYKELIAYIQGKVTLEEAVRLIKRNTRRYAKRQFTWFKSIKNIQWIELPDPHVVKKCIKLFSKKCKCEEDPH